MNRIAGRSAAVTILVLLLMGGFVFFLVEYFINSPKWVMTPGSPHVYEVQENNKQKTGVVTDRDGILLLNMNGDDWTYSTDEQIRKATLHWVGDREGNIEAPVTPHYYEDVISYDLLNGLYVYGKDAGSGGAVQLTISAKLQTVALEALGDRFGTVAVYNYKTGELLCAVTTPTYDPDNIPENLEEDKAHYDGVYMNRFIQVRYTPGSIFKIVTLAAALENIPEVESQTFTCTGRWDDTEKTVTCEKAHGEMTLKEAFRKSCNCTFATLARQMGAQTMQETAKKLRILEPLQFDGLETVAGNYQAEEYYIDLGWSAIGQHKDQINPCTYMRFMGAIAGGGRAARPYVVESATDGTNGYQAEIVYADSVMSSALAQKLQEYMRYAVENEYGDDNFPGLTVCAKTGTAEKDEGASNAMFAGFVADEEYPLAFIVCVEEGGYGSESAIPIASQVLAACKEMLDS